MSNQAQCAVNLSVKSHTRPAPRWPPPPRRDQRERHRRPLAPGPAGFSGQAAGASPAAGWARSRLGVAHPELAEGLALTAGSPPRCYTGIPPGRAGFCCLLGAPGGGRARRRRAQPSGSRPRLEREHGDSAGVGGGPKTDARPRAQGAEAAWVVRLKPEHGAGRTARSAARGQEVEGAQPS